MTASILVVGSTGFLGRMVVALLREAGLPVRALVRPERDNDVTRSFAASGVEIVRGDLKDEASLAAACRGVGAVVTTATSTSSRLEGDSVETVDERGGLALVDAAKAAGVSRFVYVSFAASGVDFALQRAKRRVEDLLRSSGMVYTILQPTYFLEGWLSPNVGFDPARGEVQIFGKGQQPVNWISIGDVARFAVAAVAEDRMSNRTLALGGPDALSPLDVLGLFRELGAPPTTPKHIPEESLEKQRSEAPDALAEAYAGLMLGIARGQVVEAGPARDLLPGRLSTVREFAIRSLKSVRTSETT